MFKAYQEYKDSGVEWLGEIPKHWDINPTKHCFKLITDKLESSDKEELLSIYTDIGVKPRKELKEKGNRATTTEGYWIVKKQDLIVNKLLAWMGAIGISEYDGVTSPAYDILRAKEKINPYFYNYLFRCGIMFNEFRKNSRGVMDVRLRLYFSEFGSIKLPCPPITEQTQIANYLDGETQKIDQLIAKQEKLIALLEEQRKSIISHAVTKGLNPNAAMKDSGVEWLGEVPKHWEYSRIKNLCPLITDKAETKENEIALENIESWTGNFIYSGSEFESFGIKFSENDILFGKLRPYLAKVFLATQKGEAVGDLYVLRPNTKKVIPKYLQYTLLSSKFIDYVNSSTNGAKMPRADWGFVGAISVYIPDMKEQKKIIDYIEYKKLQVNNLIQKQTALIDKLKEYRASIISHAVTGKIDVRELIK